VGPAGLAQARRSWQRGPARRAQLAEAAAQQFYRLGFYRTWPSSSVRSSWPFSPLRSKGKTA